jgi:plasmid stability protein
MDMASITIRNLDDDVKTQLRTRAAGNGHSMEEEARLILREAVSREAEPENLAAFIHECFAPYGGVELELPPRGPMREPPRFD